MNRQISAVIISALLATWTLGCSSKPESASSEPAVDSGNLPQAGTDTGGQIIVDPISLTGLKDGQLVSESLNLKITTTYVANSLELFLNSSPTPICSSKSLSLTCAIAFNFLPLNAQSTLKLVVKKDGALVAEKIYKLKAIQLGSNICRDAAGNNSNLTQCLTELAQAGIIAGNEGNVYDNLDGDHTRLNLSLHPGIVQTNSATRPVITFSGLYSRSTPDELHSVVFGNSSVCMYMNSDGTGDCASVLRWVMSNNYHTQLNAFYSKNAIMWHPEHRDHDLVDHHWFQVPFSPLSQGSSSSEMDEVNKFFYATAALRPRVKEILLENRLIAPTLQMLFRRTRVDSDAEYLSWKAHPTAFDNVANEHKMVRLANEITEETIPPVIQLSVQSENYTSVEKNAFTYKTAIARLRENSTGSRKIVVSAQDSYDINGRPLTYHWAILKGFESEIIIRPLNAERSIVEIEFLYVSSRALPLLGGSTIQSKLSVVGAFVHNGSYYSAPGMISNYSGLKNAY